MTGLLHATVLYVVFGVVLAISVLPLAARLGEELPPGVRNDRWATGSGLASPCYDAALGRTVAYPVTRVPAGLGMMWVAGPMSGLLGIGSGTSGVLAMDTAMRRPMKVSTTASNCTTGVTAAAGAGLCFGRGDVQPLIAAPVALGALPGAGPGSRLPERLPGSTFRELFVPLMPLIAPEMLPRGPGVRTCRSPPRLTTAPWEAIAR